MTHRFTIIAACDPQTLPRVVGQLARRWLTPDTLTAARTGDELTLSVTVGDLSDASAQIVAETLRSCVLVRQVVLQAAAG